MSASEFIAAIDTIKEKHETVGKSSKEIDKKLGEVAAKLLNLKKNVEDLQEQLNLIQDESAIEAAKELCAVGIDSAGDAHTQAEEIGLYASSNNSGRKLFELTERAKSTANE